MLNNKLSRNFGKRELHLASNYEINTSTGPIAPYKASCIYAPDIIYTPPPAAPP